MMRLTSQRMGLSLLAVVLPLLVVFALLPAPQWWAKHHNQRAEANIRSAFPATTISRVWESGIPGLYAFSAGDNNTFYADPSGRYLVVGHIFDMQTINDKTVQDRAGQQDNLPGNGS
ncbi:MAG TPA: disulfide isomerase DsbC N-terminal domain-containing protein [Candidatus Thiothrix moscowensis]|uniref:disulfide isomerase DsbC N-terminal domain-containing protein n=1 Tax=unclassified Thiothrix TaxID=2636184 RepID=UPI0025E4160D|nr:MULTISPECIES: disulfide isomerase DsbC N-terminal domain-containing protein [unclassified Thiothrix]HRJ52235.1 disulfide isomerase DsbC N-terminal domain-containing protein [Candidatus Thiothrix moscowensis]HRJ92550.1 disulfide isomerase DsbC N-terminal domain-containing protein [Candidatus Thiothrix moscowensis]